MDACSVVPANVGANHLPAPAGRTVGDVLLTGATGFVGSHVLAELVARGEDVEPSAPGRSVWCLVRADDEASARCRLVAAFAQFGIRRAELPSSKWNSMAPPSSRRSAEQ